MKCTAGDCPSQATLVAWDQVDRMIPRCDEHLDPPASGTIYVFDVNEQGHIVIGSGRFWVDGEDRPTQ
jgi:hypothetical protein